MKLNQEEQKKYERVIKNGNITNAFELGLAMGRVQVLQETIERLKNK